MRSYTRKLMLVGALVAPLAALAADTSPAATKPADEPPCGMPCCAPGGERARPAQKADTLSELLGGQNGWATSFDSP